MAQLSAIDHLVLVNVLMPASMVTNSHGAKTPFEPFAIDAIGINDGIMARERRIRLCTLLIKLEKTSKNLRKAKT